MLSSIISENNEVLITLFSINLGDYYSGFLFYARAWLCGVQFESKMVVKCSNRVDARYDNDMRTSVGNYGRPAAWLLRKCRQYQGIARVLILVVVPSTSFVLSSLISARVIAAERDNVWGGISHRWAWSDPQAGVGGGRNRGWGWSQNRFSKNRFASTFFSEVSRRFSEGQKWSVNFDF